MTSGWTEDTIKGGAQFVLAEGLEQALSGASSEEICSKTLIPLSRNKDNRNCVFSMVQFALQLWSRHAG